MGQPLLRAPGFGQAFGQHRPAIKRCRLQPRVYCQAATSTVARPNSPSDATAAGLLAAPLACELVQGNQARFSEGGAAAAPTCLMVHGLLGSRRNLQSFARMVVQGFPTWQVLLVDLRCHGDSAAAAGAPPAQGPHTVESAARDVLSALRERRLFPHVLIGHSFGGKVVMSMAAQFGGSSGSGGPAAAHGAGSQQPAAALPRPVQVWVLDAQPGPARASPAGAAPSTDDPAALIDALRQLRPPFASRADVVDALTQRGFSLPVARWMTTNLRAAGQTAGQSGRETDGLTWSFDLNGIAEMYRSYESTELWNLLAAPPQGLKVDFVRATRSNFRWTGEEERVVDLGHRVHALEAGHWVATDNPQGLFDILAPSFGEMDLHMRHASATTPRSAR